MDVFDLCSREKNRILIMNVIVEAMIREQKVDAVLDEVLLLLVTQSYRMSDRQVDSQIIRLKISAFSMLTLLQVTMMMSTFGGST